MSEKDQDEGLAEGDAGKMWPVDLLETLKIFQELEILVWKYFSVRKKINVIE